MAEPQEEWVSLCLYESALAEIKKLKWERTKAATAINEAMFPLCVDGGGCCDRRAAKGGGA